jgi:hypothetical protein
LPRIEVNLARAMREGRSALPDDLGHLRSYLRMIAGLLEEKADELEPSWDLCCAAAAEIAALQDLERSVAERAIELPADSLDGVRNKLAIWRALSPDGDEADMDSPRSRLILSVEADLDRLSREARR